MTLAIEEAKPTLLAPDEKPPAASQNGSTPGAGDAPPTQDVVPNKYSEEWVRKLLTYACKSLADDYMMPELRISVIELELMTPALTAVLNAHAPDVVSGTDPRASVVFVCLMVVIMGGRRALLINRKRRREKKIGGEPNKTRPASDKVTAPAVDPANIPTGGAFGSDPVVLGGTMT